MSLSFAFRTQQCNIVGNLAITTGLQCLLVVQRSVSSRARLKG